MDPFIAHAGPYLESAHGSSPTYGVNRSATADLGYAIGNCAHCHEQHSSIAGHEPDPADAGPHPFALFSDNYDSTIAEPVSSYSQADNFCFSCHSSSFSLQVNGITNYDYSGTFAGRTGSSGTGGASPTSIMEAMNKRHRHNLGDLHAYALANPIDFPWYTNLSNPCTTCHNPHLARRNKAYPNDLSYSVLSLPDHFALYTESIASHASQLGQYYISPTGEPSASETPDYNAFCLYCHENQVPSGDAKPLFTPPNRYGHGTIQGYFMAIDWTTLGGDGPQAGAYIIPGDKHGLNPATDKAALKTPFTLYPAAVNKTVLACVNCHEAHGSENDFMHRRAINGSYLGVVIEGESAARGEHCRPCHTDDGTIRPDGTYRWKDTHHGGGSFTNDNPYRANISGRPCTYCHGASNQSNANFPIPCEDCHFHGSYVDENDKYVNPNVKYVKPDNAPFRRKTF